MTVKKSTRFEVFKRDKFTCQYCGRAAPEVVLHVDHIIPRSKHGTDDAMNLVTSCVDCNLGKGKRKLSDDAAIQKQKKQLDLIQQRREQLEMMVAWQQSLMDVEEQIVSELAALWAKLVHPFALTETGLNSLRAMVKRHSLMKLAEAMQTSVQVYIKYEKETPNKPTSESVEKAFNYIPRIIAGQKRMQEKPYLNDLYYTRGILRNRLNYINERDCMPLLEQAYLSGVPAETIKTLAKQAKSWTGFKESLEGAAPKQETDGNL